MKIACRSVPYPVFSLYWCRYDFLKIKRATTFTITNHTLALTLFNMDMAFESIEQNLHSDSNLRNPHFQRNHTKATMK